MKIFLTGATGFIGKHLVEKMKHENQITINLYGNETSPFSSDVSTYKIDEANINKDIEYFKYECFDGIIHLASLYLNVHEPVQATRLIDSNVRFSTHVIECAVRANVSWFINTGTYWQHYNNSNYNPVNLYAASKQAFECISRYYVETNLIRFNTLKLSDTFGPNDTRPKIFNIWERIAHSGETLEMSGGEQLIDISYIDDVISAFYLLAEHLQNKNPQIQNGQYFAVKAEKRYSLKELALLFEEVTGLKLNIKWGARPYKEREVMHPWENGISVPGWNPSKTISEGISQMEFNTQK